MKIYGTYRPKRFGAVSFGPQSLNGTYHPSFFLDGMFAEYTELGLTKIIDGDLAIPDARYTAEIFPGVRKLTRFIIGEYNENYVNKEAFIHSVQSVGQEFQIEILSDEEAKVWIRENTDLPEIKEGVFLIQEENAELNIPRYELTI